MSWRHIAALALTLAIACGSSQRAETCGAGTINLNGTCVLPDAGPAVVCGAGTLLVAGQCAPVDAGQSVSCGSGTVRDGGACIPVDAGTPVSCGAGTVQDGGECVPADAGPTVACGPGTLQDGGECDPVDAGQVTCGPGTVASGSQCVPECPTACVAGHTRPNTCLDGVYCNCAPPYYGDLCELDAGTLLPGTAATGNLTVRSPLVYYGVDAPNGGSVTVTASDVNTMYLEVYTANGYLPFYPDTGQPQFASLAGSDRSSTLQVAPASGAGVPSFVMLRLANDTDPLYNHYTLTFTPTPP